MNLNQSGAGTIPLSGSPNMTSAGSLKVTQATSSPQLTAPTSYFQPATNPNNYSSSGSSQPSYSGQVGNVVSSGPTAAQIAAQQAAAQRAAEEQAKTNARNTISGLIDQAIGVYDTLYGNVRGAASEQKANLLNRYNTETGELTKQFNNELPVVGRQYAGRGLYDSGFRVDAENAATDQFNTQISGIGRQYEDDRAKIGADLAAQEAELGTGKSLLDLTRSRLGQVTDLNELMATQDAVNQKIAELQGKTQTTGSRSSYLNRFNQVAGSGDRLAGLKSTLTNIIQGAAPAPLKKAIANQIIGSSGLTDEEKAQASAIVTQQIG